MLLCATTPDKLIKWTIKYWSANRWWSIVHRCWWYAIALRFLRFHTKCLEISTDKTIIIWFLCDVYKVNITNILFNPGLDKLLNIYAQNVYLIINCCFCLCVSSFNTANNNKHSNDFRHRTTFLFHGCYFCPVFLSSFFLFVCFFFSLLLHFAISRDRFWSLYSMLSVYRAWNMNCKL